MHNVPTVRVRAVLGRLFPVMSGHPDRWIGWHECSNGYAGCQHMLNHDGTCTVCGYETEEHTIPKGTGPRDAPAMMSQTRDKLTGRVSTKTVPEFSTGRNIRLRRDAWAEVKQTFDISRALRDGDLELWTPATTSTIEQRTSVAAGSPAHAEAIEAGRASLLPPVTVKPESHPISKIDAKIEDDGKNDQPADDNAISDGSK